VICLFVLLRKAKQKSSKRQKMDAYLTATPSCFIIFHLDTNWGNRWRSKSNGVEVLLSWKTKQANEQVLIECRIYLFTCWRF